MNLFATPGYLIPPLAASGISIILLVIILRRDYRRFANRIFSLLLATIALWGFILFGMRASPDAEHALAWDRAIPFMAVAMGVLYLHFSLLITRSDRQRKLLRIAYIGLALTGALSPTGLFIERMDVQTYGYAPIFTPLMYLVFAFGYFLYFTALYNLNKGYRRSTTYEEKNRLLYLVLAMIFPILGGVLEVYPSIYPTSIFGNIIFCLFATVAIVKYHLLDVRIVIRKGLA